MREWMQNKSHHYVHESRTYSKRLTWCEKTLTPSSKALTKRRHELIPGHCPQSLTTRIVRKLYPRDMKHIRNQLQCDRDACTSENALKASSSCNQTEEGEGSEDEESPERRGFRVGVDLRLGTIDTTNVNRRRGRERTDNQKSPKQYQIYQVY